MKLMLGASFFLAASSVSAQYYFELDGVRGETTKTAPVPSRSIQITPTESGPVACTMDAKMCPDGSYVGRVAPNCEFAPCPAGTAEENPLDTAAPKAEPAIPDARPSDSIRPPLRQTESFRGVFVAAGDVNGDSAADEPISKHENINGGGTTTQPRALNMGVLLEWGDNEQTIKEALRAPEIKAASTFIGIGGVDSEPSSASANASKGKNIRKTITVNLRVAELRAADESRKSDVFAVAPKEPEEVKGSADFALFLLRESEGVPGVESVVLRDDSIEANVVGSGKLFGLFSITFPSVISIIPGTVDEEPRVEVDLPWYSFLVNEDVDKDELQNAAAAAKKKKTKPEGTVEVNSFSFGPSNAGMYRAVSNVLKTKHDTVKNSIQNIR